MTKFRIDLDNETPETIEAGNQAPPGWYQATLDEVYDDETTPGMTVFKYKVTGGLSPVWNGRIIFDRIVGEDQAEGDPETIRRRTKILGHRLGLITDGVLGQTGVELDWADAMGKEVVLEVKERSYKDKKTGEQKTAVGVDFAGVYPRDYPQVKLNKKTADEVRRLFSTYQEGQTVGAAGPARRQTAGAAAQAQTPAVAIGSGTGGAAAPPVDISDL